jgi:drug/metabolite transporter (DMT)-like permease
MTTRRDAIDLVALGAVWGAAFLLMRVSAPAFGPIALIAVRVAVAAAVLIGLLAARGGPRALADLAGRAWPLLVVGALNTAVPFTLFAYAALSLPAGMNSTLNATVPLFGAIVGWVWLGHRPTARRLLGLAVGFAGVVVLAWPRLSGGGDARAVAAALSAAALYAIGAHVTPRWLAGVGALVISTGSLIGSTVLLTPLAVWQWPSTAPSPLAWVGVAVLGVVCTALAYVLYFRLLARAGPPTAMTVTYLIPVFGVTWGALLLDERVSGTSIIGGLLVLAGVALTATGPARRLR